MPRKRKYGLSRKVGALAYYDAKKVAEKVINKYIEIATGKTVIEGKEVNNIDLWGDSYKDEIANYLSSDLRVRLAKDKLTDHYKKLSEQLPKISEIFTIGRAKHKGIPAELLLGKVGE